ncbi:CAP domain-containing protein [Citreimonas sp.]|uniref:CAP domain-containing protein n=1 Tax=Citreimonas sp. TaxID=3036715 RepID=UPI004059F106
MRTLVLTASLLCTACVPVPVTITYGEPPEPVQTVSRDAPAETTALNAYRTEAGVHPVVQSEVLTRVAQGHALDMARNGFFAHRGSDGSRIGQRAKRAGFNYCSVAENLAMGQTSLAQTLASWRVSPGHYRNMVSPKHTRYGLARAEGDIWVLVLGRPGC